MKERSSEGKIGILERIRGIFGNTECVEGLYVKGQG
jgi:hypothetical protein